jgi:UDPglucose 6-dehydrogenase
VLANNPKAILGVLGLAYKENTHSTKNSPSLALIENIRLWPIRVYDPVVPASAAPHPSVTDASSALDAAKGVDALLVMTPWPEFRGLKPADLRAAMKGQIVIDPFCVLDSAAMCTAGLRHLVLGTTGAHA